ncbi:hypothetical protein B0H13DRAFT_2351270 [Mycena leptocephala]|nr:hypothetical protein B0H13DRAFT_2351270 [Mycena leptocephala]
MLLITNPIIVRINPGDILQQMPQMCSPTSRAIYQTLTYLDGCHLSSFTLSIVQIARCVDGNDSEGTLLHVSRISLVLEDSGNVARDHLASERTFLSYVRASLTIVSAAVALAQLLSLLERLKSPVLAPLRPLEKYARQLAVGTIIVALLVLFMGVFRYFTVQGALPEGKFPVTRFRLGLIAMALGAIVLTMFGMLLA